MKRNHPCDYVKPATVYVLKLVISTITKGKIGDKRRRAAEHTKLARARKMRDG